MLAFWCDLRYMRNQEPTVSFTEVLHHLVIKNAANDPQVKAVLNLQRFWRRKKSTELLKSKHLGEAIDRKIKQIWPHVQLIVHVRQNYFLARLPQEIRDKVCQGLGRTVC